ncbi:MAG: hypothetical protein AAGD35_06395 [Actinomycetota bacterium]
MARLGFGVEIGPHRVQTSVLAIGADQTIEATIGPLDLPSGDGAEPGADSAASDDQVVAAQRQLAVLGHGPGVGPVHLSVWDAAWEPRLPAGPTSVAPSELGERVQYLSDRLQRCGVTVGSYSTSTAAVSGIGPSVADAVVWTGPRTATIVRRLGDGATVARTVARDQLPPPWRYGGLGRFPSVSAEGSERSDDLLGLLSSAGGVAGELTLAGRPLGLVAPEGARGPVPLPFAAIGAAAVAAGLDA